jgi:hypothetical protein
LKSPRTIRAPYLTDLPPFLVVVYARPHDVVVEQRPYL